MPGVIVKHLLRFAGRADVVLHRRLIKVLLIISKLEQQRDRRRLSEEMGRVDLTNNLTIFLKLAGRLTFPKIDLAGIGTVQENVSELGSSGRQGRRFRAVSYGV